MKRTFLLSIALVASLGALAQTETENDTTVYPGYKLVFHDEFNVDGKPDPNYWSFEHGYVRNHEDQYYQEDNAFCKDGKLIIEGRKESVKNEAYKKGSTDWKTCNEYTTYTSSSMISKGQTSGEYVSAWMYGRFEIKAKIPCYMGCWPAIWTLGTEYDWPSNGEVDLMEYYPSGSTELLHANVAWGSTTHWVAQWASKTKKIQDLEVNDPNWKDEFHVWRMDWDSTYIKLYVDNILLNSVNLDRTINPRTGWFKYDNINPYRDHYQYILLNLALGGDNGGSLSNTPFPCQYQIDYVRIYQKEEDIDGIKNLTPANDDGLEVNSSQGDIMVLSTTDKEYKAHVNVFNISGSNIYSGNIKLGGGQEVPLPHKFLKGIYIVNIITTTGNKSAKVIVTD